MLVKKVGDLAVLIITLRRHKDAMLCLIGQVLTNLGNGKHDLLHGTVTAHDFNLTSML